MERIEANANKKSQEPKPLACNFVVGLTGFEPATPASRTRCSTKLSHNPMRERSLAHCTLDATEKFQRSYMGDL